MSQQPQQQQQSYTPHATPAPAAGAGAHTPSTPAAAPVTAAYQYSAYPSPYGAHAPYNQMQMQGAYPYQAAAPYQYANWKYAYNYAPQTPAASGPAQVQPRPAAAAAPAGTATTVRTNTPTPARATPTFSSYTPPAASSATSQARESATVAAASTGGATGRGARKQQANVRGLFTKELKTLMYGFGDDRNPATDTVNVMEEILIEYITDVCQTAGTQSKRVRLSIEELRRVLSRPPDAKKLARMEELLFMQEDIKRARAQFSEDVPKEYVPKEF
ncbi:transcription initiation factor IID, 18kD subunit-domain-containing protein [Mycena sanguinolenta]|nr:transcription initiation factor IID, 18kD subunit-domain-containing protein [Mycena sanguinolenta]